MHTLISTLVVLSGEKCYMAVTEIQLKTCRFHGSLSHKGSRPLLYMLIKFAEQFLVCFS